MANRIELTKEELDSAKLVKVQKRFDKYVIGKNDDQYTLARRDGNIVVVPIRQPPRVALSIKSRSNEADLLM
jgi:hypothetical protein